MDEHPDPGVVGVVGPDVDPVVTAVEGAGATVRVGDAATVLDGDVDVVVTRGESALLGLVAAGTVPAVPVLPIEAGIGVPSVPAADAEAAVESVLAGDAERTDVSVLRAIADGDRLATALCEFFLVTGEHARISEFTVQAEGRTIGRFRADGVVVATPAGSHGYARTVGGPRITPATDAAAVVPVAPFATDPDHWVTPLEDVRLTVARDEAPVELLADDRIVGDVSEGTAIAVDRAGTLSVLAVAESRGPFDDVATG